MTGIFWIRQIFFFNIISKMIFITQVSPRYIQFDQDECCIHKNFSFILNQHTFTFLTSEVSGRFLLFPPFSSLTGLRIIDRILYPIARPFAGAMGTLFLLMNDNARSYRANILNRFLQAEPSEKMELPSMSLDLNPIEHLNHNKHLNHIEYLNHIEHIWDFQKRHIQQWDPAPSNINELEVIFLME